MKMPLIYSLYDQLAEVLANSNSKYISSLKANQEMQTRFDLLLVKSKENSLSEEEKDELNHFIVLERLVRLAKIRAAR
ncbi:MAG: hypothetical protein ACK514_10400 [Bacteroidota bacterium]|jgi:hypothetical protein|nr:hypothetical protein [Cytophagales bacterium]MCE2959079.1 hypothetical protein [Flammeovirgaceae bacterium]MCZ8069066.1 hypothetical protein [Cytophagales bacterium]